MEQARSIMSRVHTVFVKLFLAIGLLFGPIASKAGPEDPLPWPWQQECHLPWNNMDGIWVVAGSDGGNEYIRVTISRAADDEHLFFVLVQKLNENFLLEKWGWSVGTTEQLSLDIPMQNPQGDLLSVYQLTSFIHPLEEIQQQNPSGKKVASTCIPYDDRRLVIWEKAIDSSNPEDAIRVMSLKELESEKNSP